MDKSKYPYLEKTGVVHLDASAAFPLHERVIKAVDEAITSSLGAPGKASYTSAVAITRHTEAIRRQVADFIGAHESEVFFTASATDAARFIVETWAVHAKLLYSPEDHSRVIAEIKERHGLRATVGYLDNGEYEYSAMCSSGADVAMVSSLHHVYGSTNDLKLIRHALPDAVLAIDASQSISRHAIDVKDEAVDALFFSSQKVGGIAGVGILYIAKKHHASINTSLVEPNTIPYVALVSLSAALAILRDEGVGEITQRLASMTIDLIGGLEKNPLVSFTKGPAYPHYACYGNGIISFSVDGYTSHDVAMILDERGIHVRAGDHCLDPHAARQDVVRISAHQFTTDEDIQKVVNAVQSL